MRVHENDGQLSCHSNPEPEDVNESEEEKVVEKGRRQEWRVVLDEDL